MGYRRQAKRFRLTFDEAHELHGLEVVTKSVPIGVILTVMRAAGAGQGGRKPTIEDVESVSTLFDTLGDALIEWNFEDEAGEPVPATPEGLRSLDLDFVTMLSMEWVEAVIGASAPLGKSSQSGPRFPETSLPMTPLGSLAS